MNAPAQLVNAAAPWAIYDSIVIGDLYGSETSANGWFTTMAGFGQKSDHLFFKGRNQATCGAAYNNQQSQDRTDFAFWCKSIGLRFFGPPMNNEAIADQPPVYQQSFLSHFWQYDLPNHVALSFVVEQDEKVLANGYLLPSGYGPSGHGASMGYDDTDIGNQLWFAGSQGVPDKKNRFHFKSAIGIPRNAQISATMWISEWARDILDGIGGPWDNWQVENVVEVPTYTFFGARYGIQCSLYGIREVQIRGSYHK